jgi:hypothetical protein
MRNVTLMAILLAATLGAAAQVTVTQDGDRVVMESGQLRAVIAMHGGRVAELVNKVTGNDIIALWKGANEIGGALDDRLFFTSMPYACSIVRPGGAEGIVRLTATHASGLGLVKIISLKQDESLLRVRYELSNGTQEPYRLWIRNFLIPGGGQLTDAHQYFLPLKDGLHSQALASNYFTDLAAPWAGLHNPSTAEGVVAVVPGVEKFYFWQGSREYPTFEWLYPEVPAGKMMALSMALTVVNDPEPDWASVSGELIPSLAAPTLHGVPGWVDEATLFGVTEEERTRGFWLSTGHKEGKQRLPERVAVDMPLDEKRSVYVGINVVKRLGETAVAVEIDGPVGEWVKPAWESSEENVIAVDPLSDPLVTSLMSGTEYRLWLNVDAHGRKAGDYEGSLILAVGAEQVRVAFVVTVWPVRVPAERPFDMRGYGTLTSFTGSYDVTEESIQQMDGLCGAYADIGGSVLDWTVSWWQVLAHAKLAETGEMLPEVARMRPEQIQLDNLPQLDFSYFDPWLDVAKKHGITRVETYLSALDAPQYQGQLLDPAVGKGLVKVGTPESDLVIEWVLRELKRYMAGHGFRGYFCKIADEISPEHIPAHIRSAELARRAGWRPFTTITGIVARTAEHVNTMGPYCDQWQLSMSLKDDFLPLIRQRYRIEEKETRLDVKWGAYVNGGAENTYGATLSDDFLPSAGITLEQFTLIQDGIPLEQRGTSPWGNHEQGVFFLQGPHLYAAPREGAHADASTWSVRLKLRVPDEHGELLARIKPDDEVWFYGGGSHPYRTPYEGSYLYPMLAAVEDFDGYGWWAFQWFQASEKVVWYDPGDVSLRTGPAYLGLRDGWRDTCLFDWVVRRAKWLALDDVVSEEPDALVQTQMVSREVYRWRTIASLGSPVPINRLRRALLEAATRHGGQP